MVDIAKQIQSIIDKRFRGNQAAFARAIEVSPTTISSYLNPKKASKPTSEFLSKMVDVLGINPSWLLTGYGEMDSRDASVNGDSVNAIGQNSLGKVVGNVTYNPGGKIEDVVRENETENIVNIHDPEDLHQIDMLTLKVTFLVKKKKKQEDTINDLRETVKDLREQVKELKAQMK